MKWKYIQVSSLSPPLPRSRGFHVSKFFSKLPFLEVARQQVLVLHVSRAAWSPFQRRPPFSTSFISLFFLALSKQSLSQNIQTSDGIHSQHKQMNILQTITSNGGALQVIQAHSVQKSSSRRAITSTTYSSQFSSNFTNGFSPPRHIGDGDLLAVR